MRCEAVAFVFLFAPVAALAQWNVPPESARCPSKWGAGDERGSGNHMKNPQNVLRGARLIKAGEVIELSHVLGRLVRPPAHGLLSVRHRRKMPARPEL